MSGAVLAQGAVKPDAAAAAAMERAQRQASNPMRMILEASKARPKSQADAAPVAATPATTVTRTDAAGSATAVPRTPAPEPITAPVESTIRADALLRQPGVVVVPALDTASNASQPLAALAPLALPAAPVARVKPQIVSMVEPVIPARVQDDLGPIGEVAVDITIRADGSVAAVALVPPAPRQIQRYVVAALEQWRYEPLPAEHVHRVQLVFNSGR